MNKLQIFIFLVIFNLKSALCVYGEYAKQRKKPDKFTYLHYFCTKTAKGSEEVALLVARIHNKLCGSTTVNSS